MEYRSRAVRSLVELHDRELRSFLEAWKRFEASGLSLPEAHGDESYASHEKLAAHLMMSARGYLTRVGEWVQRPVTDVDDTKDTAAIAARLSEFAQHVLEAYPRHLSRVTDDELDKQVHKTRWGDLMSVEMRLEHAVVHPMRHRIQLERMLESAGKVAP